MFGPQVRTLDYILERVRTRFGRTTPELEAQFVLDLTDMLRGICAEFPYWFLRLDPGTEAVAGFPYANVAALASAVKLGAFIDQGWLYTTADTEGYGVFSSLPGATADGMGSATRYWGKAELAMVNYAKVYDLDGNFLRDLKVVGGDVMFSLANYTETGTPQRVLPASAGFQTTLRLSPIPDQEYLLAVSGQYAYPPWFKAGTSWANLLLIYYPRVMYHLGMMYFAEYFQETQLHEWHYNMLYGDGGGRVRSDIPKIGLIGQMKIDTRNRESQETPDMVYGESVKDLVGRDGRSHIRRPGSGYYYDGDYA